MSVSGQAYPALGPFLDEEYKVQTSLVAFLTRRDRFMSKQMLTEENSIRSRAPGVLPWIASRHLRAGLSIYEGPNLSLSYLLLHY